MNSLPTPQSPLEDEIREIIKLNAQLKEVLQAAIDCGGIDPKNTLPPSAREYWMMKAISLVQNTKGELLNE